MNRKMRRQPKHPLLPFEQECGTVHISNNRMKPNTASKQHKNKKRRK